MLRQLLAGLFVGSFLLVACTGKNYIYTQDQEIENGTWSYQDSLNYSFEIVDTAKVYNILLGLDHSVDYPYQNLYLKIHTLFPTGKRLEQQVSFELADKYGQWYGDCGSDNCELQVDLQRNAYFNAVGKHTITVEQFMRHDPIEGINGVSLSIEDQGISR